MQEARNVLQLFHVLSAVLMAGPFYMLMAVNERARMGSKIVYPVDRYMENIIFKAPRRCIWWLLTILLTGLLVVWEDEIGISGFFSNWVLDVKLGVFLVILTLLYVVVFRIEPRIEGFLKKLSPDKPVPEELAVQLGALRKNRKKISAICLFLVLTEVILGLQVHSPWPLYLTISLLILTGIFAWRVFSSLVLYGWL